MPLATYECKHCNREFDYWASRSIPERVKCKVCAHLCKRVFKPFYIFYGLPRVSAKGEYMPGLGKVFYDTFEYKKALEKANLLDVDKKDYEMIQREKEIESNNRIKAMKQKIKDEVMKKIRAGKAEFKFRRRKK